jgi:hypothetical protein
LEHLQALDYCLEVTLMNACDYARAAGSHRIAPTLLAFGANHYEETDQEFRDFIESISLTEEEMLAFLASPELSTAAEARRLVAKHPQIPA